MTPAAELRGRAVTVFALAAVAGLASVLLPGPEMDSGWLLAAVGLTLLLLALGGALIAAAPRARVVGVAAIGYLLVVALLRHASEGPASGFLPLTLLPIVWLGVFGTRRELIVGVVVLAADAVRAVPRRRRAAVPAERAALLAARR